MSEQFGRWLGDAQTDCEVVDAIVQRKGHAKPRAALDFWFVSDADEAGLADGGGFGEWGHALFEDGDGLFDEFVVVHGVAEALAEVVAGLGPEVDHAEDHRAEAGRR